MKKVNMWFMAMIVLAAAASLAYAGSFPQPSITNFKKADKYYNGSYLYNCVFYARWLQPKLPTGMTTLAQKKGHIKTYTPKKGEVAILDIYGNIGHVAYVAGVDNSGKEKSITLYEANYPAGVERKRVLKGKDKSIKDIEKQYHIIGYWKP